MKKAFFTALALTALLSAQDAKTVISNASKAMGIDGVNSIYYYGVGQNGNLGQNNNSNQPWPMAGVCRRDRGRAISSPAAP